MNPSQVIAETKLAKSSRILFLLAELEVLTGTLVALGEREPCGDSRQCNVHFFESWALTVQRMAAAELRGVGSA